MSLDSQSFFKSSRDRGSFGSVLLLEPRFEGESKVLHGVADLKAATFFTNNTSFAFDAREAYVGTASRWSDRHEFALGRKVVDWSMADREWSVGTWNPRFTLDPFQYEQVGVTGIFYGYRSQRWSVNAMVTPISVPEQGIPLTEDGGRLVSASPMWVPLQEKVQVMNNLTDIRYALKFPDVSDIVVRPAAAIGARYRGEGGFWAGGSYGYMPVHQPDVAVQAVLDASNDVVQSDLHPRFPMHHLMTAEIGYEADYWSLWASVTGEVPQQLSAPKGWLYNRTGNALITAWGGELRWQEGLRLRASYLQVDETVTGAAPDQAFEIKIPTRYNFRRAWRVGAGWGGYSPISYDFGWTFDAENSSNLVSMDVRFSPWAGKRRESGRWSVGVGADFISTATGEGWIGQYQGDDRVRGKVSYEF